MWLTALRIAPDLDSIMCTLAGDNDEPRGWGCKGESERVSGKLRAYGIGCEWFTLGDLDPGTHLTRTHGLRSGLPPSEATAHITPRWDLGVRHIPATDDEVETHVHVDGGSTHFQSRQQQTRLRCTAGLTPQAGRSTRGLSMSRMSRLCPTSKRQGSRLAPSSFGCAMCPSAPRSRARRSSARDSQMAVRRGQVGWQ